MQFDTVCYVVKPVFILACLNVLKSMGHKLTYFIPSPNTESRTRARPELLNISFVLSCIKFYTAQLVSIVGCTQNYSPRLNPLVSVPVGRRYTSYYYFINLFLWWVCDQINRYQPSAVALILWILIETLFRYFWDKHNHLVIAMG